MHPEVYPGDRLIVLGWSRPRPGDVVVVADPREPARLVVKRLAGRAGRGWLVLGDNARASTDSRAYGPVAAAAVRGRVVYRYFPPGRVGRFRRGKTGVMGVRPRGDVPPADRRTETLRSVHHEVGPDNQLPGRASRVPGQLGESPEPMGDALEPGAVEMARGQVPGPGGEPGDVHGHGFDHPAAMPGTSEQARPVAGVRTRRD